MGDGAAASMIVLVWESVQRTLALAGTERRRTPDSIYVDIATGATPFTVTVTNATDKTSSTSAAGRAAAGQPGASSCDRVPHLLSGRERHHSARQLHDERRHQRSSTSLEVGPATYALKVLQQQANGNTKVLDSEMVDVILAKTVVNER